MLWTETKLGLYLWVETPKNWKQGFKQIFAHPCSEQYYSQQPKAGSSLNVPLMDEWISTMWSIHTGEYYLSASKRQWTLDTACPTGEPRGHCANEISQSQITNTVWFHLHEVPRRVQFKETESRMVVARGWGGYCLMGTELQFRKMRSCEDGW